MISICVTICQTVSDTIKKKLKNLDFKTSERLKNIKESDDSLFVMFGLNKNNFV